MPISSAEDEILTGAARPRAPLGPSSGPVGPGGPPALRSRAGSLWGRVPNLLTGARLLAAPALVLAFVALERPLADQLALGLFLGAAATDFLDGWLARRLGQESALGAMLDPIADKAMVAAALLALVAHGRDGAALLLPAAVILMREILVSGLREHLGGAKLRVTRLAKWKTAAQMAAIAALLAVGPLAAGEGAAPWGGPWPGPDAAMQEVGLGLLWLAAGLTAVTGWDYFRKGRAVLAAREEG